MAGRPDIDLWAAWYSRRHDRMQRLLRGEITVKQYVAEIKREVNAICRKAPRG